MFELNEKDIKAVAASRFWRKYLWKVLGGLVLLFVVMVALLALTNVWWLGLILTAPYFAGLIWLRQRVSKAEKALIKEWNASNRKE